ncbi:MAG: alkaline phosphatase family protein [Alphaproteobacteria bacterium]|nr:alkaline phosphatase family protein [Alphaproteobacteria bacterium]
MKFASAAGLCLALFFVPALAQAPKPHNIIIFVADGLRYGSVEPGNMPNMFKLKSEGVDFTNSHSLFPTVTTVNASAITTGHYIGDTGDFANSLYVASPMISANGSPIAGLENDTVLAEMNQKFDGNYLNEETLFARARAQGFSTAIIGKLGPTRIADSTAAADGSETLILDDNTGHEGGFGLPSWFTRDMKQAFVAREAPRSAVPNIEQEVYLMKATTRIVLPHFKEAGKPFAMLFWSRDPDVSQHGTRDSLGEYEPGINGPSGKAGARDADTMLGELMAALKEQGLDQTTDVFVTADHGFVTISHTSATSPSIKFSDMPSTETSFGFVGVDLAAALQLRLFDPSRNFASVDYGAGGKLAGGAGLLGDPQNPDVVVVPNGGDDLIYLPKANAKALAGDIVKFFSAQDYVSGVFVNDRLGKFPGALPISALNLMGSAKTPVPSIYVNFRTFSGECENKLQCAIGTHDTGLGTGQGSHGSLSRAETRNFMAAIGPDFKKGFADPAPISNADITPTLARITGITLAPKGKLRGRVISEALAGGAAVTVTKRTIQSDPAENGVRTILNLQEVGDARYFDAAGFAGKTVGLTPP